MIKVVVLYQISCKDGGGGSMVSVASLILHFVVLPSSILWFILTISKHLSLVNIITVNIHIKKMANSWMGGDGSSLDGEG